MNNVEQAAHTVVERHQRAGDFANRVDAKAAALMMDEIYSELKHDKNNQRGVNAIDMRQAASALRLELEGHNVHSINNITFSDKGGKNGAPDNKAGKGDQIVISENGRVYGKYADQSFPVVELFDSSQSGNKYDPSKYSESQRKEAELLYSYLGNSHKNYDNLQNTLNTATSWTRQDEPGKRDRDQAMNAFAEKANSDPNCPLKFEVMKNDKHDIGFIVKDKQTGKYLSEVKLHDDRY